MVQSSAPTVDAFMLEVGPERLPYIQALREVCLKTLPGWEEKMSYGMPAYGPADAADVGMAFNNQVQHVALYVGEKAIQRFKAELKVPGISCGKSCIRYMNPKKMDFAVIEAMLRDIHARREGAC